MFALHTLILLLLLLLIITNLAPAEFFTLLSPPSYSALCLLFLCKEWWNKINKKVWREKHVRHRHSSYCVLLCVCIPTQCLQMMYVAVSPSPVGVLGRPALGSGALPLNLVQSESPCFFPEGLLSSRLTAQSLHLHSHLLEFGAAVTGTNPGMPLNCPSIHMLCTVLDATNHELATEEAATSLPRWRRSSLVASSKFTNQWVAGLGGTTHPACALPRHNSVCVLSSPHLQTQCSILLSLYVPSASGTVFAPHTFVHAKTVAEPRFESVTVCPTFTKDSLYSVI